MSNHPLPQSYLFSNVGVFDSNNGTDFVTGVDDLGIIQTAYANSFGQRVVICPNSVFIGNTTWQINITAPSPSQVAGGYVLLANGSWGPGGGGGSSGAGGANGSIQYSNGGVIAGDAAFTYANGVITIGTGTLNATAWSGAANSANFIGILSAANVVSNSQLQANLSNYVLTTTLSGYVTGTFLAANYPNTVQFTANLANYLQVANVAGYAFVNSAQLTANLSGYVTSATLPSLIGQNTANNANYLGGIAANQYAYANQSGGVWTLKSANYAAVVGDKILADTSAGSFVITLPATPSNGAIIAFADQANTWATNNLTINPNGANVAGSSSNLVCDVSAFFQLLYEKTGWQVAATSPPASSPSGAIVYNTTQSLTYLQTAQARANMGVAKKNYIINGAMMVSQENGSTAVTASGSYPVDQWLVGTAGGGVSVAQVAVTTPSGSPNRLRAIVTTADASPAAGDYLALTQPIEGLRIVDLLFGTSSAKTVTFQFGVRGPAGTYSASIRNYAATRSYVSNFTIAAGEAGTDVVKYITVPGDIAGTWVNSNAGGMYASIGLMGGSTFSTSSPNTWIGSNALATTGQSNFMATNGQTFDLFDVGLYEGSVAPSFQVPDYAVELAACYRYFYKGDGESAGLAVSASSAGSPYNYKVTMRITPAITATYSVNGGSAGTFSSLSSNANNFGFYNSAGNWTVTAIVTFTTLRLNARM